MSNHKINAKKTALSFFFCLVVLMIPYDSWAIQTLLSNYDCGSGVIVNVGNSTASVATLTIDGVNYYVQAYSEWSWYCEGAGHNASTAGGFTMQVTVSPNASEKSKLYSALTGSTNLSSGVSVVGAIQAMSLTTSSILSALTSTANQPAYDLSLQGSYIFGFVIGCCVLLAVWKMIY